MYVRDENEYSILKKAEEILNDTFDWQINDDNFRGLVNEDYLDIIDRLCDEVIRLKGESNG